ncbi:hypothetical protein NCCP2222_12820 [Sporosarcina sp. NCCP-2222]|uniref:hypothetical protein n=1 Tax=Sporosarcina sp. NCCP-2222 TaxID=2935073 RepID=UPI002087F30A|nr:hypothetical protein [Sporosarcina sp. NCCP-2222]GKV55335.1 hypothetical protein NCCP2222_12820 [Sporosarcina sp. NCCP-2222]
MKKFTMACFTFVTAIIFSMSHNPNSASAFEGSSVDVQQSTKWISDYVVSTGKNLAPAYYYYSSGGYHGWLTLQYGGGTKGNFYGVYAGTVYPQGTPVPAPFSSSIEEK